MSTSKRKAILKNCFDGLDKANFVYPRRIRIMYGRESRESVDGSDTCVAGYLVDYSGLDAHGAKGVRGYVCDGAVVGKAFINM